MIFLWTDALFWLLLLIIFFVAIGPKPRHVVLAWHHIARSKIGMSTLVILSTYAFIAALDCVHFKFNAGGGIVSLLDVILSPLNQVQETTYSAPFTVAGLHYTQADVTQPALIFFSLIKSLVLALFITCGGYYVFRDAQQSRTIVMTLFVTVLSLASMYLLSRHYHIMGTDKVGQDVFYQTMKSIRTGVLIGTLTTLVMFPFALFFGTIAGYFRGWVDDIVQYIYTTLSSIPDILLIVAFMLMLELIMGRFPESFHNIMMRADLRLLALCLIFGLTSWTSLCRLLRAETFKLREQDYVRAGRVLGSSNTTILTRHIVPNLMHIVFITVAMDFSALVLAEAVLSYIGVGVDSSTFSWGNMINAARLELAREPMVWWSLSSAFVFMFGLVLAANLFADVLQKSFDPRARGHQ